MKCNQIIQALLLYFLTVSIFLLSGCGQDQDNSSDAASLEMKNETNSEAQSGGESIGQDMTDQLSNEMSDMVADGRFYNMRYCEIILMDLIDGIIHAAIWGTQTLNLCPQESWEELDAENIAREYDVTRVIMNGPRHFVVDDSVGSLPEHDYMNRSFGEIEMRYLTNLTISLSELAMRTPYEHREVNRSNTWLFNQGRRVYELTNPEGQSYIMQSYSMTMDPDLDLNNLMTLGERLMLPEGWTYSTRILEHNLEARNPNGTAIVIQDELENTYQLLP